MIQVIGNLGGNGRFADGLAHFFEQFPVFRTLNGGGTGTEKFDMAFTEDALALKLHGQVQTGLSADARNDRVGAFLAQDSCDILQRQGFHVDFVGNGCVRHDGRRVGVDQHHLIPFFFQGKACLRAGIVKLGRLSDHDRTGTNDEDLTDVCALCHVNLLLSDIRHSRGTQLPCMLHTPACLQTVWIFLWTGTWTDRSLQADSDPIC